MGSPLTIAIRVGSAIAALASFRPPLAKSGTVVRVSTIFVRPANRPPRRSSDCVRHNTLAVFWSTASLRITRVGRVICVALPYPIKLAASGTVRNVSSTFVRRVNQNLPRHINAYVGTNTLA